MKNIFLIFCLFSWTACTTLNGAERCALIGEFHEGTQIGTQMAVGSAGGSIYSYPVETLNPICKKPKTEEEKQAVAELLPIAQEKQNKKSKEAWLALGGIILSAIAVTALLLVNSKKSMKKLEKKWVEEDEKWEKKSAEANEEFNRKMNVMGIREGAYNYEW